MIEVGCKIFEVNRVTYKPNPEKMNFDSNFAWDAKLVWKFILPTRNLKTNGGVLNLNLINTRTEFEKNYLIL